MTCVRILESLYNTIIHIIQCMCMYDTHDTYGTYHTFIHAYNNLLCSHSGKSVKTPNTHSYCVVIMCCNNDLCSHSGKSGPWYIECMQTLLNTLLNKKKTTKFKKKKYIYWMETLLYTLTYCVV